jgi:hypothetical protein
MTWVFLTACLLVSYAGFCRLVRTDKSTLLEVRIAFYGLTVAAILAAASVLVWGYVPGWPSALLASSMAAVLAASSRIWHKGVPDEYQTGPVPLEAEEEDSWS